MPRLSHLTRSTALALVLAAGPASADLTAGQVWSGFEGLMQGFGYAVTATETPTSNGLQVTDVSIGLEMPEENATVRINVSDISFVDQGDGTVAVTFPESIPITATAAPEGEDDVNMTLDLTNTGLELVVSGEPSNLQYAYNADSMSVGLTELIVNGEPIGRDAARVDVKMEGVVGTASIMESTGQQITQNMQVARVAYGMAFTDPESDDSALITGSMQDARLTSASTFPEGFDATDPNALAEGFATEGSVTYSNGQMEFAATESEGATSGTTQSGSVTVAVTMSDAQMDYDVAATEQTLTLSGPEIPVPVNISMDQSAFNMTLPLAASDTPEDVAFGLTFGGFEMSELLWNMFDPGAALPRDPATIALDLTGQVTPFVNFLDQAAVEQLEATGGAPGELNALTLENVLIEAAGAKLGGVGSFTFDNSDLETFDGFPRPNGQVDFTIDGANGLIDKLISMGVMTSEDAMGARMMMSMFAVPGDGPDNLTSTITINDQGHILANGMRIQ